MSSFDALCSLIIQTPLSLSHTHPSVLKITFLHFSDDHERCERRPGGPESYHTSYMPVCDGTQNVERYRYRYFFRYQIFPIPVLRLFSDTKFYRYRFRDFFRYQIFPIPVPIPPEKIKNSRYRFRYPLEIF